MKVENRVQSKKSFLRDSDISASEFDSTLHTSGGDGEILPTLTTSNSESPEGMSECLSTVECGAELNSFASIGRPVDNGAARLGLSPYLKLCFYFASKIVHNKVIPLVLGITSAIAVSSYLFVTTEQTENSLSRHQAEAEMQDYAENYEAARNSWCQAIADAHHLNFKDKLIADLHLRAARSELNLLYNKADSHQAMRRDGLKSAESDLKAALRTYNKIPNTKSEQAVVLEHLCFVLKLLVKEGSPYIASDPQSYMSYHAEEDVDRELKAGLVELESSISDFGLAHLRKYLRSTHKTEEVTNHLAEKIATVDKHDSKALLRIISLLYEVMYYNEDYMDALRYQTETLDYVREIYLKSVPSHTFDVSDAAMPVHGAIIEYLKLLGRTQDEGIRAKLKAKRAEAFNADFTASQKSEISDYIDCLKRKIAMRQDLFGQTKGHAQIEDLNDLGFAYALQNDFESAEKCFTSMKMAASQPYQVARADLCFAELHRQQGKFDLALSEYRRNLRHGILPGWIQILKTNLVAGRTGEAKFAMGKVLEASEKGGAYCTSSGTGDLDLVME